MPADKKKILIDFYKARRRMPSYGEIAKLFRLKSKSSAHYLVKKMITDNLLKKDSAGRLIPTEKFSELKVLGVIEAGFPSPAEEELIDTLNLDDYLIKNKEASYLLKVKGDSMIDAGIFEGDMVIVERGKQPRFGDIVIAEIDGEYTMKYYRQKNGAICLEPANKNYKTILPKEELRIIAIVKAVVRKY